MKEDQLVDYNKIELNTFKEVNGKMFIGNEEVKPELLDVLKTQAKNLSTSEIYEIFKSTLINEAADIALNQSQNYEHVLFAKAIKHWVFVMDNIIMKLSK